MGTTTPPHCRVCGQFHWGQCANTVTQTVTPTVETVTPEETVTVDKVNMGGRGKRVWGSAAERQRAYRQRLKK